MGGDMEELTHVVIAAQRGDLDAFSRIVDRFQDMAYALAYAMLGDAHLAEDAAQESFIEAFLCLPNLREPAAFPGWFRRIAIKRGDRLVRGRERATLPLAAAGEIPAATPDPADAAETREMQRMVQRAIAALPEAERLATTLFYIAGYSQQEIAECLEVPVSTIKKRLYTSRQRLKERMIDMAHDQLHRQRPSHDQRFSRTVQFLIAVRTGDTARVSELLAVDPALIDAREEFDESAARQYFPLMGRYTALHRAIKKRYADLVRLLLERGADVNAATSLGETPLHTAALHGRPVEAALLLERGANPNARLSNGMTPLHWAAQRGYSEFVSLLLERSADARSRDKGGRTPLDWARLKGHGETAAILEKHSF